MASFLAVLAVSIVGALAIAAAINYFMQTGPWRAFGYGLFAVAVFLIFCATGLWNGAGRHDWGFLTPVFMLLLVGGWASIKFGKRIWERCRRK